MTDWNSWMAGLMAGFVIGWAVFALVNMAQRHADRELKTLRRRQHMLWLEALRLTRAPMRCGGRGRYGPSPKNMRIRPELTLIEGGKE